MTTVAIKKRIELHEIIQTIFCPVFEGYGVVAVGYRLEHNAVC